jgi:hypothetical protein
MESKVIKSGTYTPMEDDSSLGFKTRYFSDGSAIIVTEKGTCLAESVGTVEYDRRSEESRQPCSLITLPNEP